MEEGIMYVFCHLQRNRWLQSSDAQQFRLLLDTNNTLKNYIGTAWYISPHRLYHALVDMNKCRY